MFWTILCIPIIYIIWKYVETYKEFWRLGEKIAGPPCYPILGNGLLLRGSLHVITHNVIAWAKMYKRMYRLWIGPILLIMVYDAKDAEIILRESKYIHKASEYQKWSPVVGDSLFTIYGGPKYKRNKKLILPSFQFSNLLGFFNTFNKHATEMVENFKNETGKQFDLTPNIARCTMQVLLETVFGYEKGPLLDDALDLVHLTEKVVETPVERIFKIWLNIEFLYKLSSCKKRMDHQVETLNKITDKLIRERRERKNETWERGSVFVDSLCDAKDETGACFTDEEIGNEVKTFLFAGQDTVSSSVGFALSLLAENKDVQEKLYEEISSTLKNKDYITYDELKRMDYLNRVIQETWRLYPPAPAVGKESTKNIELEGCVLPGKSTIVLCLYQLHRDPKNFPNPEKFDPDNFLPERCNMRHPYSFIPFSAGFRTCIGQVYATLLVKVMLASILRNFSVDSTLTRKDFKLAFITTLKRVGGFPLKLKQR